MRIFLSLFVAALIVSFFCVPNLVRAQEEAKTLTEEQAKEAQKKLAEALKSLKKEIRTEGETNVRFCIEISQKS